MNLWKVSRCIYEKCGSQNASSSTETRSPVKEERLIQKMIQTATMMNSFYDHKGIREDVWRHNCLFVDLITSHVLWLCMASSYFFFSFCGCIYLLSLSLICFIFTIVLSRSDFLGACSIIVTHLMSLECWRSLLKYSGLTSFAAHKGITEGEHGNWSKALIVDQYLLVYYPYSHD